MPRAREVTTAALALAGALLPLLASTPASAQEKPAGSVLRERRLGVMGTDLVIETIGPDPAALERAMDAAEAELRRVEDVFTDWRPSELMRINEAAGAGPVTVTAEQVRVIGRSIEISRLTGGAFDVTFASVGKLWDFKRRPPVVPSAEAIREALKHVGWERIAIDVERSTVAIPAGTRIGLGGIAKGYGIDRAMDVLIAHGVRHGIVKAGGDMKALGRKFDEPWQIAIKHPRDRERVVAVLPVVNACLSTSGDYERFFEVGGKRYHHILDPRTGYPATGCIAASVIAPDSITAEGLSTAMCVMGPEAGMKLIEELPRVEALLIGLDGEVHVSSGLRKGVGAKK